MSNRQPSQMRTAKALLSVLTPKRRRDGMLLLILMLLGALTELATVIVIVPFLTLITGQREGAAVALLVRLDTWIGVRALDPITTAGLILGAIALGSAGVRLILVRASQTFVFDIGLELSTRTYAAVLQQPLAYHLARNSSAAIAALQASTALTKDFMLPAMQGVVAAVIAIFVMAAMLLVSPLAALVSVLAAGLMYGLVVALLGSRLRKAGGVIAAMQAARLKTVQEGIGGIRDVLIGCAQPAYLEVFEAHNRELGAALAGASFTATAPRLLIETAGMIGVAMLTIAMAHHEGGLIGSLPQLSALALALLKLVPLFGQAFYGWAQANSNRAALADVLGYIALPIRPRPDRPLAFSREIELRSVRFTYQGGETVVLDDIGLSLGSGEIVGLVGRTGSGKSTMLDVILGLLHPTGGAMYVDGQRVTAENAMAWQMNVAHVPQAIYLLDTSIAENIAFGQKAADIDWRRLRDAAERAQLGEMIARMPDGFATQVGERGIRLSGGQRQRIGIARALYRRAKLLVLDEATSALDEETEAAVMRAICDRDDRPTMLIAAHRHSTLRYCSRIYRMTGGVLTQERAMA